jgi:hypothetical protein
VAGQVVHDDDIAGTQIRNQDHFHISLEGDAIDRPTEHEGRDHAPEREAGNDGPRLPVSGGHAHAQPLAARGASMGAGHIGLGPCLIDEDETVGIEVGLAVEPVSASPQDVWAVPLARVRGLFCA